MMRQTDFATRMDWIGCTLKHEHILRYLDRENPVGRVMQVTYKNRDAVVAVDCYGMPHTFVCWDDGRVTEV